ncbi:MAG: antibiotic biosynthesis monooxygenase [Burkholderiaceae bacterium]
MTRMIRYKVKADRVAENERYVVAVYDELKRVAPPGLRYATFRLDDGASFVHIVSYETGENYEALTSLPAFKAFSAKVKERCEE